MKETLVERRKRDTFTFRVRKFFSKIHFAIGYLYLIILIFTLTNIGAHIPHHTYIIDARAQRNITLCTYTHHLPLISVFQLWYLLWEETKSTNRFRIWLSLFSLLFISLLFSVIAIFNFASKYKVHLCDLPCKQKLFLFLKLCTLTHAFVHICPVLICISRKLCCYRSTFSRPMLGRDTTFCVKYWTYKG